MNNYAMGDYYVWYCDWCDSTNKTHWSSVGNSDLACSACNHPRNDSDSEPFGLLPSAA